MNESNINIYFSFPVLKGIYHSQNSTPSVAVLVPKQEQKDNVFVQAVSTNGCCTFFGKDDCVLQAVEGIYHLRKLTPSSGVLVPERVQREAVFVQTDSTFGCRTFWEKESSIDQGFVEIPLDDEKLAPTTEGKVSKPQRKAILSRMKKIKYWILTKLRQLIRY
ncbi:uncharacterized protein LOC106175890 [Lingula anatina]|uniref:Uncharacterized protein LOC106175890 n=1 Tax=Lingula anatina TaxID=7574 RepID=A0A1S3JTS7_LINAN|nr:uncharacterized protein LOC106175890 [Lingula anatina]|eukprot:XP_013413501.1 uncharacterized protein LOC106175890 [Lingula anatina]